MIFPADIDNFDRQWALAINGLGGKHQLLDAAAIAISSAGLWIGVGVCFLLFLLRSGRTKILSTFFLGLVALGLSDLVSFEVIKPWIQRERPCWVVDGIHKVLGYCGGSYGFTSNHAANAAAFIFTMILSRYFTRQVLVFAAGLGVLVGLSRIYLGVHYPLDVLVGFVLGAGAAVAVRFLKLHYITDQLARLTLRLYGFLARQIGFK